MLHLIAGVDLATVLGVVGVLLFVPLLVVGGFAVLAGGPVSAVALAVLVALCLALLLAFLVVAAVVRVLGVAFFRYYALLILGDTNPDLDLVPERRAAIRGSA